MTYSEHTLLKIEWVGNRYSEGVEERALGVVMAASGAEF